MVVNPPGGSEEDIRPYMSSSKEFTLSRQDKEIVGRYRLWLQNYFKDEFSYEATLYMNLNKVKEFIMNEQSALSASNKNHHN